MSLKLKKVDTFRARVNLQLLSGDADHAAEASYVAEFRHLDRGQFDALIARSPSDAEVIDEVLVSVSEVTDDAGNPLPFDAARDAIKGDLGYAGATVRTFFEALAGAAPKNSNRSRGR